MKQKFKCHKCEHQNSIDLKQELLRSKASIHKGEIHAIKKKTITAECDNCGAINKITFSI